MTSIRKYAGLVLAAAIAAASPASAEPMSPHASQSVNASIFAADHGGIRTWRPDGRDAILIEGRDGQWYRATFFGACDDLRFHVGVSFVTSPDGALDRWSAVRVGGVRCPFSAFERVPRP